jgi:sugar phosphate isomerase/epimerase
MDIKSIAAQLYTLRDFLKTREDIEKTLSKVKGIGYNAVQLSGLGPVDPLFLKELSLELDLKLCATHVPYDRLKNDLKAVIKEHQLWECEYVGIGSMPGEFAKDKSGYTSFAKAASVIAKKLSDNGLKLIYHNHNFEFEKFDGLTGLDILLNESDKALGFEIDTYWVQAGGASPVQWLKKVAGRIDVVHFKDMALVNNEQVMAEIGEGNLDWPSIIDVCREIKVKWYAVEQDVCRRNPFESLAMSFDFMQKFL